MKAIWFLAWQCGGSNNQSMTTGDTPNMAERGIAQREAPTRALTSSCPILADFRNWPKADMAVSIADVRFEGVEMG